MRYLITLIAFCTIMSCSLSKTEREARNTIDGTWVLNSVTYDATGNFNVELFNDTSAKCFEMSKWFFRSNNSTGSYEIVNADCPTGTRNIRWSAVEVGKDTQDYDFTMKLVDEKYRDKQEDTGFRMNLKYLDANTMTITQTVNFEGAPFKINMNFARLAQ
ncbi:Lipocalin-like domain-containing protein [Flavobacteriaceae bacterium MAR_2010_188]|nr:Lipocalin-like domain-containing protein [Flavobacteriaceae bacterium MAR_2010_188]